MLKKIGLILAVLIAAWLVVAATRPDSFRMERSITINAPADKVFPLINDLGQWAAWSPWEKKDAAMKRKLSNPSAGVGASYDWQGNSEVGTGRMQITESTAPSKLVIQLDFIEPFAARNTSAFNLAPEGGSTRVTWSLEGQNNFVSKLMQVFVSMDSMVGPDYEAGLKALKALAER
ncbi:MAG: SRPBCC family protein [Burkholderiales bacterium]